MEIIRLEMYLSPDIELNKEQFKRFIKSVDLEVVFVSNSRLIGCFLAVYNGKTIKGKGFKKYTMDELME